MQTRTSLQLTVANGSDSLSVQVNLTETPAGLKFIGEPQSIATGAWTAIALGSLASFDLLMLKNLDAANYIQVALDNAGAKIFGKLAAGRGMVWPVEPGATIYAQANTAACLLMVLGTEP
jgi:hypothetical protein